MHVLSGTAALASTCLFTWSPVLPLLLAARGATRTDVAATFALVNLALAAPQYVGGRLSDRIGARMVIGWTGVALGITWLAMALASATWTGLAAGYILGSALFGLQSTAFVTIVADSVPPVGRTGAFAEYQFWSAVALVVGPLLGAVAVLPALGPGWYLGLTGAVYLAVGVVRLALLQEPRPRPSLPSPGARAPRLCRRRGGARAPLLLLTTGVTLAFAFTVNGPFMATATHAIDHMPTTSVDLLFGVGPIGALLATAVTPRVGGGRLALALGLLALGAAVLALALPLGATALVLVYLLAFAGYQIAMVAFSAERVRLARTRNVGEALGASAAVAGIVACAAVLAMGPLGERLPLAAAALLCLATAASQAPLRRTGRPGAVAPPRRGPMVAP